MYRDSLTKFVIISLILHFFVFSIVFVYYQVTEKVALPRIVETGIIGAARGSGAKSNTTFSVRMEARRPDKQIKEPGGKYKHRRDKPQKKVIKSTAKKKESISEIKRFETRHKLVVMSRQGQVGAKDDIGNTKTNSINTSGLAKYFINGGSSSKISELAYPDYRVNPKPSYPVIARRRGYEGTVLLRVWVLETGKVGKIKLQKSSRHKILDKTALEAVENWIFVPGRRNGEPVSSWVTIPIKFQLNHG